MSNGLTFEKFLQQCLTHSKGYEFAKNKVEIKSIENKLNKKALIDSQ